MLKVGRQNPPCRADTTALADAWEETAMPIALPYATLNEEASTDGVESLTGVLAHLCREVRDPLNVILGFAQIIADGRSPTPPALRDYASLCDTAGGQLLRLLDNAALWLHARQGDAPADLMPIELGGLLEEVLKRFEPRAAAKGVRLVNAVSRMPVAGEPAALCHLLCQLLDNALRYSRPGGTITVTALRRDATVDIRVADTGVGMAAAQLAALFRATPPVPLPDTDGNAGSGLGLLLCKLLAERMDGAIRLDSRPGHGTTATVSLGAASMRRMVPAPTPRLVN